MERDYPRLASRSVLMLIGLLLSSVVLAFDGVSLRECVDAFEASRQPIQSYCVRIQGIDYDSNVELSIYPKLREQGKFIGDFRNLRKWTLEIACDREKNRWVAIESREALFPELAFAGKDLESMSRVYLIDDDKVFRLQSDRFIEFSPESLDVPDPLSLGGAFWVETCQYYSLAKVVKALRSWDSDKSKWTIDQSGTIVTFRNPYFHDRSLSTTSISFDTQRGYLPVAIFNGDEGADRKLRVHVDGRVTPKKIDGHWLPNYVRYQARDHQVRIMHLEWFSINQPLPIGLFDREQLLRLVLIDPNKSELK